VSVGPVFTNPGVPAGFRELGGILVPVAHERERQVWTKDEWRLLDRATKLLNSRGIALQFQCMHPGCDAEPIERLRHPDGGIVLRCAHADRTFVRKF
jgi:hypothetical protein